MRLNTLFQKKDIKGEGQISYHDFLDCFLKIEDSPRTDEQVDLLIRITACSKPYNQINYRNFFEQLPLLLSAKALGSTLALSPPKPMSAAGYRRSESVGRGAVSPSPPPDPEAQAMVRTQSVLSI